MSGLRLKGFPGRVVGNEERGEMHSILDFKSEPKRSRKAFSQDEGNMQEGWPVPQVDYIRCVYMYVPVHVCMPTWTYACREARRRHCTLLYRLHNSLKIGSLTESYAADQGATHIAMPDFFMCSGDSNSGSPTWVASALTQWAILPAL